MPTFQYGGMPIKRHRRRRLTMREMIFVDRFLFGFMNLTQSAIVAGFSPKSAKWQGYRLIHHDLATMVYYNWRFKRARNGMPIPTLDDLVDQLNAVDAFVYLPEVLIVEYRPKKLDFGRMDHGNQRLAHLYLDYRKSEQGQAIHRRYRVS